jgi:hypothetical protein
MDVAGVLGEHQMGVDVSCVTGELIRRRGQRGPRAATAPTARKGLVDGSDAVLQPPVEPGAEEGRPQPTQRGQRRQMGVDAVPPAHPAHGERRAGEDDHNGGNGKHRHGHQQRTHRTGS